MFEHLFKVLVFLTVVWFSLGFFIRKFQEWFGNGRDGWAVLAALVVASLVGFALVALEAPP